MFTAKSNLCPGLGLFAGQLFDAGDFVDEYRGEIMNCQEGERRGLMAELLSTSYLYSLSKHDEIDAQFAGSLMKFANNSFEGMINTVAKIIFVEGRRHIVLYASR